MKKTKGALFLHIVVWLAVLAIALPLVLLLVWSFANRWPTPELFPTALSLRGWQRLFSGYFNIWQVTLSSVTLSLWVGAFSAIIAAMAARAICLYSFPGKRLLEALVLLPVLIPATVFGMSIHALLIRWRLNNSIIAVVLCQLICALPFAMRVMLETTRLASARLEEQARVLGAGSFAGFLHGSLPAIAPGLVSAWALSFLFSYTQYFLTLLVGGGKIKTLAILVMPLIEGSDRTISSVYSLLFIGSTAGIFWLMQGASALLSKLGGKQLGGA